MLPGGLTSAPNPDHVGFKGAAMTTGRLFFDHLKISAATSAPPSRFK